MVFKHLRFAEASELLFREEVDSWAHGSLDETSFEVKGEGNRVLFVNWLDRVTHNHQVDWCHQGHLKLVDAINLGHYWRSRCGSRLVVGNKITDEPEE